MIREVTGVRNIRMLYLQLQYRCNFTCRHCFHGDLLQDAGQYSREDVYAMLGWFRQHYELQAVTLLGGEPLLYPSIAGVCSDASALGLQVEICTNGHFGFRRQVTEIAPYLARLRVSLDGMQDAHDRMRQQGSFASAFKTIDLCRDLGVPTGATMTVTAHNLDDVVPLARLLQDHGVMELKLHCLRLVGNAALNPDLLVRDTAAYEAMHDQITAAGLGITVRYDADLSVRAMCGSGAMSRDGRLDRIEADPHGDLTMSCKAVGTHASAFRWDSSSGTVIYRPHASDELQAGIPDVVYQTA